MLKNDTLKNGTSCIGLYGSAPPGLQVYFQRNQETRDKPNSRENWGEETKYHFAWILWLHSVSALFESRLAASLTASQNISPNQWTITQTGSDSIWEIFTVIPCAPKDFKR